MARPFHWLFTRFHSPPGSRLRNNEPMASSASVVRPAATIETTGNPLGSVGNPKALFSLARAFIAGTTPSICAFTVCASV